MVKAYTTRVGEGPLPSQFPSRLMAAVQKKGDEFGSTTGRPRRCGWFDAVVVRHSVRINGLDEIAMMKLDVLSGLPEIKIATAYRVGGRILKSFPSSTYEFERCRPVYETVRGWREDLTGARKWTDLPTRAQSYLKKLEKMLEPKIKNISVGSDRTQTIIL